MGVSHAFADPFLILFLLRPSRESCTNDPNAMLPLSVRDEHEFLLHSMADCDLSELFCRMVRISWNVMAKGSANTVAACSKDKPCFFRLAAALLEFHSKITLLSF
jgi:hypothetical protein